MARKGLEGTPTSDGVTKLDRLQSELREGPCITAIDAPSDEGLVVADDLSDGDEERWPRFAQTWDCEARWA